MSAKKPDAPELFREHLGPTRFLAPKYRVTLLTVVGLLIWVSPIGVTISSSQVLLGFAIWFVASSVLNRYCRHKVERWLTNEVPWTVLHYREEFDKLHMLSEFLPYGRGPSKLTVHVRFIEHPLREFVVTDRIGDIRTGDKVTLEYRLARDERHRDRCEVRFVRSLS